jgi:hypothetical protein
MALDQLFLARVVAFHGVKSASMVFLWIFGIHVVNCVFLPFSVEMSRDGKLLDQGAELRNSDVGETSAVESIFQSH